MKCKSEFDEEAKMYAWAPLGCGNYAPNFFGTSVPEVVEVRENPDGTVTLTVMQYATWLSVMMLLLRMI